MPEGGTIEVSCTNVKHESSTSISLPNTGNYVKMSIEDSGTGIPSNVIEKIFDPYFSTKQQGSGLGLATTHSIVSKHNGHISVQSTPGLGTTFMVFLPASAQSSATADKLEETDLSLRKSKIMVMDDEELVRDIARAMLTQMGHEVLLAKDGLQAVQLYEREMTNDTPIDLTIMDLTIPGGMGGKEAVQRILAVDPEAKVIVSSGYTNDPVMANSKDFGFCSAIVKPYELQELKNRISHILGSFQDGN
jgi:two-component system cell cycle sensor histidine kinase/response regulator CckA